MESLSAYATQFLGKINKPDVDVITGIAPAIAIEQKVNTRNPRSTVGTATELYDYLKLLYARIGHTFSPVSGQEVKCYTEDDVAQYILSLPEGSRVAVAAPLQLREGQGVIEKLTLVLGEGIPACTCGGRDSADRGFPARVDENTRAEDISIVVDRAKVSQDGDLPTRLRDSVAPVLSPMETGFAESSRPKASKSSRPVSRPTASNSSLRPNICSASTTRWAPARRAKVTARSSASTRTW